MLAYRDPAFDLIVGEPSAWTSSRLPDPAGLAAAYEAAGGVPLVDLDLRLALAHYKIAVIAAGIAHDIAPVPVAAPAPKPQGPPLPRSWRPPGPHYAGSSYDSSC